MKRIRLVSFVIMLLAIVGTVFFWFSSVRENDKLGPTISMSETNIEISIKDSEDILFEGVKAVDLKDGDVTDSVVVESVSGFLEDGRRIVTYAAFDGNRNVGKATRQICYSDYHSPRFEISQPFQFASGAEPDYMEFITVNDCLDGDISSSVIFSKGYSIYSDYSGEYNMQLEVTNSAGDTSILPVTFTIYDKSTYNQTPRIILNKYIVYTSVGKSLKLESYIDSLENVDEGVDASSVKIDDSAVNYSHEGVYEAVYTLENEEGYTGSVRLIIVVE